MSTMRANILANAAGTQSPDVVGGEFSRARFNLNGTGTIAPRDTFNVSSFTDNGVGDYTATFAIAFPNSDYSSGFGSRVSAGVDPTSNSQSILPKTPGVSSLRVIHAHATATAIDPDLVCAVIVGDKP